MIQEWKGLKFTLLLQGNTHCMGVFWKIKGILFPSFFLFHSFIHKIFVDHLPGVRGIKENCFVHLHPSVTTVLGYLMCSWKQWGGQHQSELWLMETLKSRGAYELEWIWVPFKNGYLPFYQKGWCFCPKRDLPTQMDFFKRISLGWWIF